MAVTVTLKMYEGYPNISSGIVSFENTRTGTKISIKAPEDLESGIHGIQSITMDTGAGCTILPEKFAQIMDIEGPTGDMRKYQIFSGVGGTSVCFASSDLIIIGIEYEEGNRIECGMRSAECGMRYFPLPTFHFPLPMGGIKR